MKQQPIIGKIGGKEYPVAFKFEIANQGARTPKFKTENYVVE